MKPPKWLWTLIITLVVLDFIGLGLNFFSEHRVLGDIANFSLVLTLAMLLVYAYYTYLLAKEAWTPSASFALKTDPNNPYHFAFLIKSYSKVSLECWCNLNPTVYGQAVSLAGFYGGQSSFDLQPFGTVNGVFCIEDILSKTNRTLKEMDEMAGSGHGKEQLYLDIEFWYNPIGTNSVTRNPRQPHYFDFTRRVIVADF